MSDKPDGLNPLDDVKGVVRVLRSSKPARDIAGAMATSARVLEPAEADLRVIAPEDLPPEIPGGTVAEDQSTAEFGSPTPDQIARHKRHRGY